MPQKLWHYYKNFKPQSSCILLHISCILQRISCTFHCRAFRILRHRYGRHRRIAVLFEKPYCSYFCIHPHTCGRHQHRLCINFRIVPFPDFLCSFLRIFHILLHMPRRHQCRFAFVDYPF